MVHEGTARIYLAQGDFENAVKEMKISLAGAPDNWQIFFEPLVKKLVAKEDINQTN